MNKKVQFNLIIALTKDGLIGQNKVLPWKISEEIRLFNQLTNQKNSILLFGSNTFNHLPSIQLDKRQIIIIGNKDQNALNTVLKEFASLNEFLNYASEELNNHTVWICGGKTLYETFPNELINKVYCSFIKEKYIGNSYIDLKVNFLQNLHLVKSYKEFDLYFKDNQNVEIYETKP
ncbi:dihydrofolate reductase [Mycoplasma nasistruthionis]|uniref:dihydrofolate reductase n=1 Tax=Mycoplasma nasistruthionis TaxID=353852 RepID=A0A5B7XVI1_9MOLU|nr:dihydrofolate reductase [Mycoplasma nasistruthionis]QCZ36868.1 hypothetical protein FG904_02530 [Mycoplasma nasistruthionis]